MDCDRRCRGWQRRRTYRPQQSCFGYILSADLSIDLCRVQQARRRLIHGRVGCPLSFRHVQRRSIIHYDPATLAERFRVKRYAPTQALACV